MPRVAEFRRPTVELSTWLSASLAFCKSINRDAVESRLPSSLPSPASDDLPPPSRPLTVADLAGEWKHGGNSIKAYVDSSNGHRVIANAFCMLVNQLLDILRVKDPLLTKVCR